MGVTWRRFEFIAFAMAVGILTSTLSASAATSQDLTLANWGNRTMVSFDPLVDKPITSDANDDFSSHTYTKSHEVLPTLAAHGRRLETAGSGSLWVFDSVHHIMAVDEFGDVTGTMVFEFSGKPPGSLPQRDLSNVRSARGLRLGMSSAAVLAILHLPSTAVRKRQDGAREVHVRQTFKCLDQTCAHDEVIVFRADRAVAIDLRNVGP